jgi:uncharacterized membrane protein
MAITAVTFVVLEAAPQPDLGSAPHAARLLLAWDAGITVYLVLAWRVLSRFEVDVVRRRAAVQDDGALALLLLTTAAAIASLAAIVALLGAVPDGASPTPYFAFAVLTVALSWTFVHVLFAIHYAHEFYEEGDGGGLEFPRDDRPDYWDFVYFSFVIGMTCQVSDVAVTAKHLRRLVVLHGFVAFVFNATILALVVNIGATLV